MAGRALLVLASALFVALGLLEARGAAATPAANPTPNYFLPLAPFVNPFTHHVNPILSYNPYYPFAVRAPLVVPPGESRATVGPLVATRPDLPDAPGLAVVPQQVQASLLELGRTTRLSSQRWAKKLMSSLRKTPQSVDNDQRPLADNIPTYFVTPNGQRSFYNNFDPFNPAAPLRDMREYLLAIKKKELMASPGFQGTPVEAGSQLSFLELAETRFLVADGPCRNCVFV